MNKQSTNARELADAYNAGMTLKQLGQACGLSVSGMSYRMLRAGLQLRTIAVPPGHTIYITGRKVPGQTPGVEED